MSGSGVDTERAIVVLLWVSAWLFTGNRVARRDEASGRRGRIGDVYGGTLGNTRTREHECGKPFKKNKTTKSLFYTNVVLSGCRYSVNRRRAKTVIAYNEKAGHPLRSTRTSMGS